MPLFGRKDAAPADDEPEDDFEQVAFQGPVSGDPPDMSAHAALARAGLGPARELISDALSRRGEMIRLETRGAAAAVKMYIDGVAYPGGRMPARQAAAITQVLKLLCGLNVKERSKKQAGALKADLDGTPYILRIETEPVAGEKTERLTVRAENQKQRLEKPEELGITPELKEAIRELTGSSTGLLLVAGPPLSGVTTTVFGVLRSVDSYVHNIYALGDLGGRDMHTLTDYTPETPDTPLPEVFAKIMRLEADVVYMDPLRDAGTAKHALEFAEDLSLIAEVPAKDAVSAAGQMLKWSGDAKLVADRLSAVIQPKLVRKLCGKCKQAFRPNPKLAARIGLPEGTELLYKPPGREVTAMEDYEPCSRCGGVGYLGRTGLFALLKMDDEMREILTTKPSAGALKRRMKESGTPTFETEGLRLVAEGVTSLEELQRAFQE